MPSQLCIMAMWRCVQIVFLYSTFFTWRRCDCEYCRPKWESLPYVMNTNSICSTISRTRWIIIDFEFTVEWYEGNREFVTTIFNKYWKHNCTALVIRLYVFDTGLDENELKKKKLCEYFYCKIRFTLPHFMIVSIASH